MNVPAGSWRQAAAFAVAAAAGRRIAIGVLNVARREFPKGKISESRDKKALDGLSISLMRVRPHLRAHSLEPCHEPMLHRDPIRVYMLASVERSKQLT